jgi:hypothetical protein
LAAVVEELSERLMTKRVDPVRPYAPKCSVSGDLATLRSSWRASQIVVVGHNLTENACQALPGGAITCAIPHPYAGLACEAFEGMLCDCPNKEGSQTCIVPIEICPRENV